MDGHIKSLETTFLNAGAPVKVAPHVAGALAQLPQGFDDTVDLGPDASDIDSDAQGPTPYDGSDNESDGDGGGEDSGGDDTIDLTFDPLSDYDNDNDDVAFKMGPGMVPEFQQEVSSIRCFASQLIHSSPMIRTLRYRRPSSRFRQGDG